MCDYADRITHTNLESKILQTHTSASNQEKQLDIGTKGSLKKHCSASFLNFSKLSTKIIVVRKTS